MSAASIRRLLPAIVFFLGASGAAFGQATTAEYRAQISQVAYADRLEFVYRE